MGRTVKIFDTTLRDGEQSPGCSMNLNEKIEVAKQLEALKVDIIEAGFAAASPGDAAAIAAIADTVRGATICSLARCREQDIEAAWNSIRRAESARIHTFLATSPVHMEYKLKMTPDEVLESVAHNVAFAKKFCSDIEFSAEDATRSDLDFLCRVVETAIKAGATTINIPDTVGYMIPQEYASRIKYLRECTINGIGERAGNASMEECVMALKTRADHFGIGCNIETTQIYRASRMIQTITGVAVAPTKPIVGANAFAHEAGIHQHGVMANKETYEIMTPESVGIPKNAIVLGKHSGRHAFEERLHELGYTLDHEKLEKAFEKFKILADKKKVIKDRDLEGLIGAVPVSGEERYTLDRFVINSGNTITSTAVIRVKKGDEMFERAAASDGPINASFHAIDKIIGKEIVLEDYSLRALTDGEDAQSEAIVKIRVDGSNEVVTGRGVSVDVMEASIKAYINGINKYFND